MSKIFGVREKEDGSSKTLFTISPDGGNYEELVKLALGEDQRLREGAIAVGRGVFLNVYDLNTDRYSVMFFDMTTGEQSILDLGLSDYEELEQMYPEDRYRYMGDEYICFLVYDFRNRRSRLIDLNTNTLQSSSQDYPFDYFQSISRNLVLTVDGIYSRSDYSVPYDYVSYYWRDGRIYEPDIPDGSYKYLYFYNAEAGSELGLWLADYGLYEYSSRMVIPEQRYFPSAIRESFTASSDLSRFFAMGYYGYDEGRIVSHLFISGSGGILREVEFPRSSLVSPSVYTQVPNDFFLSGDGRYAVAFDDRSGCVYSVLDNGAHYDLSAAFSRIDRDSMWILLGSINGSSGEEKRPVFWTELKNTVEVY